MHLHHQQRLPLLPCQGLRRGRWRLTAPAEVRFQRPTKVAGAVGKVCQLGANVWIQNDSRFLSKMLLHAFFPQINHIRKPFKYIYIYIHTEYRIGIHILSDYQKFLHGRFHSDLLLGTGSSDGRAEGQQAFAAVAATAAMAAAAIDLGVLMCKCVWGCYDLDHPMQELGKKTMLTSPSSVHQRSQIGRKTNDLPFIPVSKKVMSTICKKTKNNSLPTGRSIQRLDMFC